MLGELPGRRCQKNLPSEALGPLPTTLLPALESPGGWSHSWGCLQVLPNALFPLLEEKKDRSLGGGVCPTFLLPGSVSPTPDPLLEAKATLRPEKPTSVLLSTL